MNSNNNFLNSNFFQNTPQKDDKNKGWIIPSAPGTGFGAQSTQPGGFSNPGQMLGNSPGIFGQTPGVPAFGMGTPQQGGGSPVGQGLGTFGSTPNAFGSSSVPSTFGNTTPVSNGFGSAPNTFGTPQNTLNAFGGTPGAQSTFGSTPNTFGSASWNPGVASSSVPSPWSMNTKGSKAVSYNLTRIKEDTGVFSDLVDITGMKEYSNRSADEIRKEDYEMSFSPPKSSTGFGSSFVHPSSGFPSTGQSGPSTGIGMPSGVSSTPFTGGGSSIFGTAPVPPGFGTAPASGPSTGTMNIGQSTGISSNAPIPGFNSSASPFSSTGFGASKPLGSNSSMLNAAPASGAAGMQPVQSSFPSGLAPSGTAPLSSNPFGSSANSMGTSSFFGNRPSSAGSNDSTLVAPPLFSTQLPKPQPPVLLPSGSSQNLFPSGTAGQSGSLFGVSSAGNQAAPHQFGQSANPFGATQTAPYFNPFTNSTGTSTTQIPNAVQMTPFQSQASNSFMNASSQALVDMSDPYMIKDVKFEKIQQQKPSIKIALPTPIFSTKKDVPAVDLKIRPPKPIARSSIYTIPDLNDVDTSRPIPNLVVGFESKGRIEYQEPVSIEALDSIEKRVMFRNENVEVNDPIGTGLNKKARVYVEGLFPVSRATNEIIKGRAELFPQKGIQERFIYQLKNDPSKKFIDYDADSGIYVYEVNHF